MKDVLLAFKETFRQKTPLFLGYAALVIIMQIAGLIVRGVEFDAGSFISVIIGVQFFFLAGWVFVIWIIRIQEKIWSQNRYRLLPISNRGLVLGNHLSTFVGFLLITLIGGVMLGINILTTSGSKQDIDLAFWGTNPVLKVVLVSVVVVLTVYYLIVFVSFLNALAKSILELLPVAKGRLVVFLVYAATVFGVFQLINLVSNGFNSLNISVEQPELIPGLAIGIVLMLVMIAVLEVLSTFLIRRFIETAK